MLRCAVSNVGLFTQSLAGGHESIFIGGLTCRLSLDSHGMGWTNVNNVCMYIQYIYIDRLYIYI